MKNHQHTIVDDEDEKRFLEDLEKAKALSLEEIALEKFRQEKLRSGSLAIPHNAVPGSSSPIYAQVDKSSKISPAESSSQIQIKPRPRPGGIPSSAGFVILPPLPLKKGNQQEVMDLINLRSTVPIKLAANNENLDEEAFLQELDLACPNLNLPPSRSSRQGVLFATPQPTKYQSLNPPPKIDRRIVIQGSSFDETSLRNRNLIDLGTIDSNHPRYSILSAFDPLLNSTAPSPALGPFKESVQLLNKAAPVEADPYDLDYGVDPFDYFLGISQRRINLPTESTDSTSSTSASPVNNRHVRETIYEVFTKEQSPVKVREEVGNRNSMNRQAIMLPPLRNNSKESSSLTLTVDRASAAVGDADLATFVKLVRQIRSKFRYDDLVTNSGYVTSPMIEASCGQNISVKMVVYLMTDGPPVNFTCDIGSRLDHVISHVICELQGSIRPEDYAFKVWDSAEFLSPDSCLNDYEYVHRCIKLKADVVLCLLRLDHVHRPLLRTAKDDEKGVQLSVENLLLREPADALTYESVCVLLETIRSEMERLISSSHPQAKSLLQSVKALCFLLGSIETTQLSNALENLMHICSHNEGGRGFNRAEIVSEDGPYSIVVLPGTNKLRAHCAELISAIANSLRLTLEPFGLTLLSLQQLTNHQRFTTLPEFLIALVPVSVPYIDWNLIGALIPTKFVSSYSMVHNPSPEGRWPLKSLIHANPSYSRTEWFSMKWSASVALLSARSRVNPA